MTLSLLDNLIDHLTYLLTDRQTQKDTEIQTDRQTDGTAIPTAKREVVTSSALQHWTVSLRRTAATDKLVEKIVKHDSWPIQPYILNPPLLRVRLASRKPLWLDLQPVDIKSRWRHNWKSAQVINSHLVCDPTIRQPAFDLHRQQCSLLNCFRTEQGHCGACRRKWQLIDLEPDFRKILRYS